MPEKTRAELESATLVADGTRKLLLERRLTPAGGAGIGTPSRRLQLGAKRLRNNSLRFQQPVKAVLSN